MKRVQIFMQEELLAKLDEHCKKYSYERSEFIRSILRNKLFNPTPSSAGTPNIKGGQLPSMTKVDPNKVNVPQLLKMDPKELSDIFSNRPTYGDPPPPKIGNSPIVINNLVATPTPQGKYVSLPKCDSCGKPNVVTPWTILDEDQIRVVKSLCTNCIKSAKAAAVLVGEGDLT